MIKIDIATTLMQTLPVSKATALHVVGIRAEWHFEAVGTASVEQHLLAIDLSQEVTVVIEQIVCIDFIFWH
jgi:hypothetical protein